MSEPQGSEGMTRPLPVLEKTGTDPLGPDASAAGSDPPPVLGGKDAANGRFWSTRRVTAAIVALLLLALVGLFLYDIAAVRADRPAMAWRRDLADQLAERPLDDIRVLIGAGVATALGLWLLWLAATPGLRSLLPMRRTHPDVRGALDRQAAALVLRDRAMEIAGVQSARVRMRRKRADVRAVSHFRDLDDVRADLDGALADAVNGLGLSRPPALSVRVQRPGRKG
ncbi:DUF6286 domain-containing protein [Streptomyces sp. NPDC002779]|uniref:DUF6286 domain-containing protein n=1 Tax=Streptomyces sp. NPDC002779 TaxID=3364664 RepID=UPI00369A6A9E